MEHCTGRADDSSIAERVVAYIEQNYANQISLRDVAAAFGYTGAYLTTAFRRSTGMPVTACIIKRRVLAARILLAQADASVASACDAAGFHDLCYFTRQFQRHVGVTPGRFRSAMRQGTEGPREPTALAPKPARP
jgi:AraC family transcriptional regulator, transcriptional activator of pobA